MAKIIVGNIMKDIMINLGQPNLNIPIKSIMEQLKYATYLKDLINPNTVLTEQQLASRSTGGASNKTEINWVYANNTLQLGSPMNFNVLPNEPASYLFLSDLIGANHEGRGVFNLVVNPKPNSWIQHIGNITITVKGDGES